MKLTDKPTSWSLSLLAMRSVLFILAGFLLTTALNSPHEEAAR